MPSGGGGGRCAGKGRVDEERGLIAVSRQQRWKRPRVLKEREKGRPEAEGEGGRCSLGRAETGPSELRGAGKLSRLGGAAVALLA